MHLVKQYFQSFTAIQPHENPSTLEIVPNLFEEVDDMTYSFDSVGNVADDYYDHEDEDDNAPHSDNNDTSVETISLKTSFRNYYNLESGG